MLEKWTCLKEAEEIINAFFNDIATYPDSDFFTHKRGINKDIIEEYYPLMLLAKYLPSSDKIRLLLPSSAGPDGEILFEDNFVITVQVTCSHERGSFYKERHSLRDVGYSVGKVQPTSVIIRERLNRILNAIKDKENRFRSGTKVLLIIEQSFTIGTEMEIDLPISLEKEIDLLEQSKYEATYVIFGTEVRKIR